MSTDPHDLEALLAHGDWARALARSLVRDPNRADDLVQRAWIAAMRRPLAEGAPPRRWLAAVLRNFVREDAREVSRRERRERTVARHERDGGSDAVDDAADLQVRLIAAVRELPEPSRSTVWARYYDGLAPREIAKRDGVPVQTVKTRLARGLDMLRKRFDREHGGDRSAWIAAFMPLAASQSLTASTIGVVLMGAKWKAAVALVLAASAVTWIVVRDEEHTSSRTLASASPEVASDLAQAVDPDRSLEAVPEHAARAPIAETNALSVERDQSRSMFRGRVLDLERHPVPGLQVGTVKRTRAATVRSAADGSFAIERELVGAALEATGPGWTTVWVDRLPRAGSDRRVTILVAPAGKLSGSVLDPLGKPVAGASIDVGMDDGAQRTLADVIDADPHRIGYATFSDADGRFDLGEVPLVDGTIRASLDGRDARAIPIPTRARDDLVIAFDAPAIEDIVVCGSVEHATNFRARVSGAYVRVGNATQRTATDGSFSLLVRPSDLRDDEPVIELIAVSENQLPTSITFSSPGDLRRRAANEKFDLVLGADPLRISGRFVDIAGNPLPGARARLEEERFGTVEIRSVTKPPRMYQTVEAILRGEPNLGVERDEDNDVFSIGGLQDRDYRLVVVSIDPPAICVLERVRAGTSDLLVTLDTGGPELRVAGRVVDGAGKPMAGVGVSAELDLGSDIGPLTSRSVSTNSEGAFELTRLRGRVVQVFADLESYRIGVDVKPGDPLDDIRIVVPNRRAIQVDVTSKPGLATDFEVRNSRGTVGLDSSWTIAAQTVTTVSERVAASLPILDGRSDVVTVDEDELTLILLRQGQEVARIPIVFAKEGVTIIRP